MPNLDSQPTTAAPDAAFYRPAHFLSPDQQLAAAFAECHAIAQQSLANLRELRRILDPPPRFRFERCAHETVERHGNTGELDTVHECPENGTVCPLDDEDRVYCLKHFQTRGAIMNCPKCNSADMKPEDEGSWPECNDCGFVQYDEATLQLQSEVRREQRTAKEVLGYVPSYQEAVKKGLCKP